MTLLSIEGCCPLSTGFQHTSVKSGCELVTFFICKVTFANRWLTAVYLSHLATEVRIFSIAYCRNYAHYDVFRLKMKQQGRKYIMTSRVKTKCKSYKGLSIYYVILFWPISDPYPIKLAASYLLETPLSLKLITKYTPYPHHVIRT